jgi:hypothetical protein
VSLLGELFLGADFFEDFRYSVQAEVKHKLKEQFLRITSGRIMLIEGGKYKLSDVYVDQRDGKTLFARLSEEEYAKLSTGVGAEVGCRATSVPTISWERIVGIAYQETAYTLEFIGAEKGDDVASPPGRMQSTLPS